MIHFMLYQLKMLPFFKLHDSLVIAHLFANDFWYQQHWPTTPQALSFFSFFISVIDGAFVDGALLVEHCLVLQHCWQGVFGGAV